MLSNNEQRDGHVAATAPDARMQFEAKRSNVHRPRKNLKSIALSEDDEDVLLSARTEPVSTTDNLGCFCFCKFKKIGQSYILYERRIVSADGVSMKNKLVLIGPHWIGVVMTFGTILVATFMFLSQHMQTMAWYNTIITLGLCGSTLYYLFQTACTDPGIIQTSRYKDLSQTDFESGVMVMEAPIASDESMPPIEKALAQGLHAGRWYCDICRIIDRDVTAFHCEDCGVCVAGYDHHCPWVGKCIGRDNMHAFQKFNASWVIYVCFVLFMAITSINWGLAL
ncbi:hypothetical protein CCR75_007993 [Bremia lactucae]|uniref:Palmitoyltransferase n=1 Tax=Bremia lactucae TaxID=4779 RepID=A0A976IKD2_BRELC|nr:hypothetical protein CCR75_007993 [Bremia lactucae]